MDISYLGNRFSYEEHGYGKEIFIFGGGDRIRDEELLSLFPDDYHVYLLNLSNYSGSVQNREFHVFTQWAEDIHTFSQAINVDKFIYMGISRWGGAGFSLALNYPEVLKAFIPIVSVPVPGGSTSSSRTKNDLEAGDFRQHYSTLESDLFPPSTDKVRLKRREKWRRQQADNPIFHDKQALSDERHLINRIIEGRFEIAGRVSDIRVPTLLLFGAKDRTNPLGPCLKSAMSIPGAVAVFFQDYSHGLFLEGQKKVAGEIISFVENLNRIR